MENIRNNELKLKRICRFCLTQDEPLTIIYSKENRVKSSVPLPLQIMACVSIEVFSNDGLPTTICESCRILMDHWYRFKQICKKADTLLKQYPLTGTWPSQLELPLLPAAIIKKNFSSTTNKRSASTVVSPPIPIKKQREEAIVSPSSPSKSVKLLNKSAPKILNKNVKAHDDPVLSDPIIKTDDSGNVEIITELLENVESYEEPDPIKFAPPVETNVFPCPNCERSFPLRQLLAIHMNNHTRERDFECAICSKRFFSKYDLGKHMLTHTGEKPYECVVCHRRFSRSTLLHRHEKIHTDQPKYLCVYCERPFLSREELDKHTEKHQKNRPFQCKVCDKSFAFKQGLERHEVVHSKNQPYPCEYCDKSFSTPSKLARHLTAHAGQRPFPCKLCPKSYLLSHHLTRHLRSHTNGTASYKCYDCGNLFNTRDDLIYHSAVHATQTLICPLCKEQFEDLDAVTEHIKSHTDGEQYACEFCDLIFTTEDRLDDHTGKDHYEDQLLYTQGPTANVKNEVHSDEDMEEYIIEEVGEEGGEVTYDIVGKEKKNVSNSTKDKTKIAKKISSTSPKTAIVKMQGTRKTLNLQSKSAPSEDNEEIEIRRSNRPSKVKDYAKLIKSEDDEGDEEEDLSFEDADYEAEEDQDDEEESLPLTRQSKTSKADKSRSTQLSKLKTEKPIQRSIPTSQQKLTKFLKTIEKPIEKSSVEKVLKNLPKAVTIIKKESGEKISNTDVPKKRETYGKIKQENDTAIKKSPKIEVVTTKYSPSTVTKSLIPQKTKVNETLKVNKPSTSVKNSGNETQKSSPISSTSSQVNERKADSGKGKLIEMVINNKVVKVQKIVMSKANIAAMAKEGKIKMKDGTMLLKKNVPSKNTKKISESSNVKD